MELKTKELSVVRQFKSDLISAMASGVASSLLLNPLDRALYLSIKHHRPFLLRENFASPYQGILQAVAQRAFLGSVYYIMQGELRRYLHPFLRQQYGLSEPVTQFYIGLLCGSVNGLLSNSVSAVKYHTWGQENRSFFSSVYEMKKLGGYKAFLKGTPANLGREMIFGSTYEVMRSLLRSQTQSKNATAEFICNMSAAGIATVLSEPLNYARTIQYGTPPNLAPPTIKKVFKNTWDESKNYNHHSLEKFSFFQRQFKIGWGTARVAVGMGIGQKIFDCTRAKLDNWYKEKNEQDPSQPSNCPVARLV